MKGLLIKFGIGFLVLITLLSVYYSVFRMSTNEKADSMSLSYFEDTTGKMDISDIDDAALNGDFVQKNDPHFTFGRSYSTFWIRIVAQDATRLKEYIALYCPNIQDVQYYTPVENGFEVRYSGWENSRIRDDEGLTYPVFSLPQNLIEGKPIYLRIQSSYAHNYTLEFYAQKDLNRIRTMDFCTISFLLGMLITVIIINWIVFYKLKSKTCLAFSICIFLLSIHQGISYGIYNILIPEHSNIIMNLSIEIGLLFIISIIIFFIIFSDVKTFNRRYYRCLLLFIGACLIGYPICFTDKVAANLYGHILTIAAPIFILYVSFRLYRAGHKNQKMFIFGWILTILLYVMAMAICEGLVKISFISLHLPYGLIIMAAVSIIFSVALTDRAKGLQFENLQMQQRYQVISERIKWTETALMQTKIKPHFLYNTLTAIEQLCETDSQKAQTAIADFAAFLRSNIDFSAETRLIRIERELANVKHYLSLEQMRFEERLNVEYDIQADGFLVPPLVVQPMVENAVRHGVTKRPEGGTINISIMATNTDYIIKVTDNGVGFNLDSNTWADGYHIGIDNARERLHRQCGGTLSIDSKIDFGTVVTMSIPKGEMYEFSCG